MQSKRGEGVLNSYCHGGRRRGRGRGRGRRMSS